MRRSAIHFLLGAAFFSSIVGCFSNTAISENSLVPLYDKDSKLLKPNLPPASEGDIALVANLDGKIYLMETNSEKILWSFSSGQPIYSSYRASFGHDNDRINDSESTNDFYVECGDDWELYLYSKRTGKKKLPGNAEDHIRNSPYLSNDGATVTLGSKKTSVFHVDPKSGKVIRSYNLADSPSILEMQSAEENAVLLKDDAEELVDRGTMDFNTVEQQLYIFRTDYMLQCYSSGSGKVLWNLTFAELHADFRFEKVEEHSPRLRNEPHSDYGVQLPHRTRVDIIRIRKPGLLESHSIRDQIARPLLPAANEFLLSRLVDQFQVSSQNSQGGELVPLYSAETRILDKHGREANKINETTETTDAKFALTAYLPKKKLPLNIVITVVCAFFFVMGSFFFYLLGFLRQQRQLGKQAVDSKMQPGITKKKKGRRSGNNKNIDNAHKRPTSVISSEGKLLNNNELPPTDGSERKMLLTSTSHGDSHVVGRRIGKLLVSSKEIAKGSNGTVVLEGMYDGRPVAVKRLVQTHHDVALKEIQNLIASDQHPNIVRWYGVEYDQDFVYLSLERGTYSLYGFINLCSENFQSETITRLEGPNSIEYIVQLDSITQNLKGFELWKGNGYPSLLMLKLMRDVVSGLSHLHELGIIHRDVKPQNVLIIKKERSLCAKLSDMGISKRLLGDKTSFTRSTTGSGSSGWQAPEQLLHRRQSRAVDIFSLGCVLFFCITGGKHPFGDSIERDVNIVNNKKDLFLVESIPEAVDLFSRLLDPNPDMRPNAMNVLYHPLFWSSEMRLAFLRDASDRVELEDRENKSELLDALESVAAVTLNGKWDEKMETAFIDNIGRYRRYRYDSIRDLLRVIRNKLNHYRELPREIQELLGSVPEGFDGYFSSRFPRLLVEVYRVICRYCGEEEFFQKYIKSNLM